MVENRSILPTPTPGNGFNNPAIDQHRIHTIMLAETDADNDASSVYSFKSSDSSDFPSLTSSFTGSISRPHDGVHVCEGDDDGMAMCRCEYLRFMDTNATPDCWGYKFDHWGNGLISLQGSESPSAMDPVTNTCDLTSEITSTSKYSVAHGGNSDLYRGEWTHVILIGEVGKPVEVVTQVAIKSLRALTRQQVDLSRARKRLNREVYVWRRLCHPNIAQFYGVSFHHGGRPSVIMRWYNNGTVPDYLSDNPEVEPLDMLRDIAEGLKYLHTLDPPVVHGDLKGCNTLVKDDGHAVLTDFGLSKVIEELAGPSGNTTSTFAGSVRWQAPELLFDQEEESNGEDGEPLAHLNPTVASDVWSFGCVAYELIVGKYPYQKEKYDWNVIQAVMKRQLPVRPDDKRLIESEDVLAVLSSCWMFEPWDRPDIVNVGERLQGLKLAEKQSI